MCLLMRLMASLAMLFVIPIAGCGNPAPGGEDLSQAAGDMAIAAGDMQGADLKMGSTVCHVVGCRMFSSNCSTTGCTCIGVIADNPDPTCTGATMTCSPDPCAGKTVSCPHATGMCVAQ